MSADIVFFVDVDNTLLDNDRIVADLRAELEAAFGATAAARYWVGFDALREELGYVDYLGALQRFRRDGGLSDWDEHKLLQMSGFLLDYPFADRLYPHALKALGHLGSLGTTVLLTDGDVVFQPHKVQRSGLWNAVDGRVLIAVHKERTLDAVQRHYPAQHYVMVDDKLPILNAMKAQWGKRLSTVFVRQGHYALAPETAMIPSRADITIERIGELADFDLASFSSQTTPQARAA